MGTRMLDSCHIPSIFRMTPSAYFTPMDSEMYFLAWGRTRSGHQERMSRSFLKVSRELEYPSGIGESSGASVSNHAFQDLSLRPIYMARRDKDGTFYK